ncbi:MAG: glycerophosphodiester phosphodiesterase family protein [Rhodobacteraceae bacterium]|nr:glycerophosphodiester phosphodiesterase family protein [Paracoccaceae bacterium]
MQKAKIICHRGALRQAPENTLASLEGAIALGAYAVEFDIQTSRDGVLYVLHDETVDRTTDGSGRIEEMTSDEIDRLDAGSWFAPEFRGQRVPRLETFLDACKGRIKTYAEIKSADPCRVRDMLKDRGILDTAWTFSFDERIRAETMTRVPDFRRLCLLRHVGSVERALELNATYLEFFEGDLNEAQVRKAKDAGLITQIYYGGDDPEIFRKTVRYGIEQMNIDAVDLFRQIEAEEHEAAGAEL